MPGIAVIARQRSGTNFLRTLIADSSNMFNMGEVFDVNAARKQFNFFTFRAERGFVQPALREMDEAVAELTGFLDWLAPRHPRPIIDIKYNQTLVSTPTFLSPADPLPIFRALAARRFCVLHLVRNDVCASIVSGLVANATGMFHVPHASDTGAPAAQVRVVPDQFGAEIIRREREIAHFDQVCLAQARTVRVRYEDVAGAGAAELTGILTDLCRAGGGSFVKLGVPAFRKGLGHWLDYVANAEELVTYLAADPAFRHHVAASLTTGDDRS